MSILGFQRHHLDPDPAPTPADLDEALSAHGVRLEYEPTPQPEPEVNENPCACRPFDAIGQNPECPEHPWWLHDPHVLDLADLTRELGSAWKAARRIAIEANEQKRGGGA